MPEQNIYDNQTFFDGYRKLRENPFSANIVIEKPALFSLCPDLHGQSVLDLGCGYGENCREFAEMGAKHIVGIDISKKMLEIAKEENSLEYIEYINMSMSELHKLNDSFHTVCSSLAFHYIENLDKLLTDIYNLLENDGLLIFSQEHPLSTALKQKLLWSRNANGDILHYNLTHYGDSGQRSTEWIVDNVVKYHRSFSDIFNALISTRFIIEKVLEPIPDPEIMKKVPAYQKDIHKPDFLLLKARKSI